MKANPQSQGDTSLAMLYYPYAVLRGLRIVAESQYYLKGKMVARLSKYLESIYYKLQFNLETFLTRRLILALFI